MTPSAKSRVNFFVHFEIQCFSKCPLMTKRWLQRLPPPPRFPGDGETCVTQSKRAALNITIIRMRGAPLFHMWQQYVGGVFVGAGQQGRQSGGDAADDPEGEKMRRCRRLWLDVAWCGCERAAGLCGSSPVHIRTTAVYSQTKPRRVKLHVIDPHRLLPVVTGHSQFWFLSFYQMTNQIF